MLNRSVAKNDSKRFLSMFFKPAIVASLIVSVFSFIFEADSNIYNLYSFITDPMNKNLGLYKYDIIFHNYHFFNLSSHFDFPYIINALLEGKLTLFISLRTILLLTIFFNFGRFFLLNPLKVGLYKFFIQGYKKDCKISYLTYFFKSGDWKSIVYKLFLKNIEILLWSLLFIFPGIFKSYQYIFVDFILAENPELSYTEAKEISTKMTDGIKMDLFILHLSFIGWTILVHFTMGLGNILLNPYVDGTMTAAYLRAKDKFYPTESDESYDGIIDYSEDFILKNTP